MMQSTTLKSFLKSAMFCRAFLICFFIAGWMSKGGASSAASTDVKLGGFVALDWRQFFKGPAHEHQRLNSGLTPTFEPEFYYEPQGTNNLLTIRPFAHLDPYDDHRNRFDLRQADFVYLSHDRRWEVRAGISEVFWGVAESHHLVDVINQKDLAHDLLDGEEKLGQPLIQVAAIQKFGTLRFFYMPYFRPRTFPGKAGRLRSAIPVDSHRIEYTSSAKAFYPSVAARFERSWGAWDVGLAHFHGVGREPRFRLNIAPEAALAGDSSARLIPLYDVINQTSVDVQYTVEEWLWKFEAIGREGQGRYILAAVGGLEYTFFQAFDTDADVGLLCEYHRDNRSSRAPGTFAENDIFTGIRVGLNDIDDTQFLAGALTDLDDGSTFLSLEASTRLSPHFKVELVGRFMPYISKKNTLRSLERDSLIQARLFYYF